MASATKISSLLSFLREALSGAERSYTTGSLRRAVALLAVPMVLEMSMESLFAVVDVFFVAKLGAEAVAAVGLTEGLIIMLFALALGLSMPATAMVARRIGEGEPERAAEAGVQALLVASLLGLAFAALTVRFAGPLLGLMGASTEVLRQGTGYTALTLGTAPAFMLLVVFGAVFRGAGEPSHAMRALWLGNGVNILLDPCLIFGLGPFPELGLFGAAVATAIGRSLGVLYFVWVLWRRASRLRIRIADLRFVPRVMGVLLGMSFGATAQFIVETSSWLFLVRIVALFGSDALAGYTIAVRILTFTLLPAWGLSNAAATLVGQNLGAQEPVRAEKSVLIAGTYNMALLSCVSLVFFLFAEPLIGLFSTEPAVLAQGATCLRTVGLSFAAYAWGMVLLQAFNGAGDTKTPLIVNLICFWALKLPGAYLLAVPLELGPLGVFIAVAIAYSLNAVLGFAWFRQGRWKAKRV